MHKKWNRIGASVIDNSVIIVISTVIKWILVLLFGSILAIRGEGQPIDLVLDFLRVLFFLVITVIISIKYCMLTSKRYGSTLGQLLLKVHVVDASSTKDKMIKVSESQLLKREKYKWSLLIGTFYLYGIFCIIQIIIGNELFHNKKSHSKVEVWV